MENEFLPYGFNNHSSTDYNVHKGRLVAIVIGIAIAIAAGAAFAFNSTMINNQQLEPTTTEGRNIVVNIEEKLGISETP